MAKMTEPSLALESKRYEKVDCAVVVSASGDAPEASPAPASPNALASSAATHSHTSGVNAVRPDSDAAARRIAVAGSMPCPTWHPSVAGMPPPAAAPLKL